MRSNVINRILSKLSEEDTQKAKDWGDKYCKILIQSNKMEFLLPENMLKLGFECSKNENGYLTYINNATIHYNTDYNKQFPESKGKVIIYVNLNYSTNPFVQIKQDGDSRTVYNGICESEEFLVKLLYSIR